jgi:hypothetical protein
VRATIRVALAALLLVGSVLGARAQSTDIENPTPLTTSTVNGELSESGNRYYSFVAAPGTVTVSGLVESAASDFGVLEVQLLSPNLASLCTARTQANFGAVDSQSCSTKVDKPQRLLLRVGFVRGCKGCSYRARVEGMSSSAAPVSPPAAAAPSAAPSAAQAGPGVRTMLIRLKDGTTMQIDLAKVADITFK